jgi:hypothetical protein
VVHFSVSKGPHEHALFFQIAEEWQQNSLCEPLQSLCTSAVKWPRFAAVGLRAALLNVLLRR